MKDTILDYYIELCKKNIQRLEGIDMTREHNKKYLVSFEEEIKTYESYKKIQDYEFEPNNIIRIYNDDILFSKRIEVPFHLMREVKINNILS